jgi:hypothetical protein
MIASPYYLALAVIAVLVPVGSIARPIAAALALYDTLLRDTHEAAPVTPVTIEIPAMAIISLLLDLLRRDIAASLKAPAVPPAPIGVLLHLDLLTHLELRPLSVVAAAVASPFVTGLLMLLVRRRSFVVAVVVTGLRKSGRCRGAGEKNGDEEFTHISDFLSFPDAPNATRHLSGG